MTTESTRHTSGGMHTRLVNAAADVISRAMQQGRALPAALAVALDSAQLLQSPDTAAEFEKLLRWHDEDGKALNLARRRSQQHRARITELEQDREASDREYETATARIAELETERHTTNEALSDAAEQLRRQRDRIAVLEKAAVEGRAALADLCRDHEDPGTAALGGLYLLQQATLGTPMQPGETVPKVYRASHDAIQMGLYTTREAAQQHCEVSACESIVGDASLDWDEDEDDDVFELVVTRINGSEYSSGYVVTALDVAAEYDEGADQ